MTFSNDRNPNSLDPKIVPSSKNSTVFNHLTLATLYQVDVQAIRNGKESGSVQAFYHTPIPPPENFRVDKENLTAIRVKENSLTCIVSGLVLSFKFELEHD